MPHHTPISRTLAALCLLTGLSVIALMVYNQGRTIRWNFPGTADTNPIDTITLRPHRLQFTLQPQSSAPGFDLSPMVEDLQDAGRVFRADIPWMPTLKTGDPTRIIIPLWLITAPPLLLAAAIHHRRRTRPGHCPHCNYNLTGLPPKTTPCPECGNPLPS